MKFTLFFALFTLFLTFLASGTSSTPIQKVELSIEERSGSSLNQVLSSIDQALASQISTFTRFQPYSAKSKTLSDLTSSISKISGNIELSQGKSAEAVNLDEGKKSLKSIVSSLHKVVRSFGWSIKKQDKENLRSLMIEVKQSLEKFSSSSLKSERTFEESEDVERRQAQLNPVDQLIDFLLGM